MRLQPSFRLRTLLIAIAMIAVGLGAYQWWRGKRELNRMAEQHSKEADDIATRMELAEKLIQNARNSIQISQNNDLIRKMTGRVQQDEDELLLASLEKAEADFEIRHWNRALGSLGKQGKRHRSRAIEFRSMLLFNLTRERKLDQQHAAFDQSEADRIDMEDLEASLPLLERKQEVLNRLTARYESMPRTEPETESGEVESLQRQIVRLQAAHVGRQLQLTYDRIKHNRRSE